MQELENKIRESLPRLKELTKGCIINEMEIVHRSFERNNIVLLDMFSDAYGHKRWKLSDDVLTLRIEDVDYPIEIEVAGHPIKLNDVLEWLGLSQENEIRFTTDRKMLFIWNMNGGVSWNLSSVFLANQSDELKGFLNRL